MARKRKYEARGRRSKTPRRTSASDLNLIATSPSTPSPTGGASTTSPVPSSAFPSTPPTTTTQLIPSAPPQPTVILPSSASQITTTQPLPSTPPLPVQETHQELIPFTPDGTTTTDLAGPSTATSALAASTRTTPTLLPIAVDPLSHLRPAVAATMAALQEMESELEFESGEGDSLEYLKVAFQGVLRSAIRLAEVLLADRKKPHGSGSSCNGTKGGGGSPDSSSGEGDGVGGGN